MRLVLSVLLISCTVFYSWGQSSKLTMPAYRAKGFLKKIPTYTLAVTVSDEYDKKDDVLIDAVKKYWTFSPVKFMTRDEFYNEHELRRNWEHLYLRAEGFNQLRYQKERRFLCYYLSGRIDGIRSSNTGRLEFKVPCISDRENLVAFDYDFIYELMIKHFAYEVNYMRDTEHYGEITKRMLLTAKFNKQLAAYASRDILVSRKDYENYMTDQFVDTRNAVTEEQFLKYIARKTRLQSSIKIVPDSLIAEAIASNNKNVLIYTGYSIYAPESGKMLRRIDPNRPRKIASTVFLGICSVSLIALVLAVAGS